MRHTPNQRQNRYKKAYCRDLLDFFSVPPQRTDRKVTYYPDGAVKAEEPAVLPSPLPTFQAFAEKIGVCAPTLRAWEKEHPEFAEACGRARQMQENIWLVNSLSGYYNSSFAQFFGKTALGYGEKGKGEPVEIVVRVVE